MTDSTSSLSAHMLLLFSPSPYDITFSKVLSAVGHWRPWFSPGLSQVLASLFPIPLSPKCLNFSRFYPQLFFNQLSSLDGCLLNLHLCFNLFLKSYISIFYIQNIEKIQKNISIFPTACSISISAYIEGKSPNSPALLLSNFTHH